MQKYRMNGDTRLFREEMVFDRHFKPDQNPKSDIKIFSMINKVFICFLLLVVTSVSALENYNSRTLKFTTLNTDKGLSQSYAYSIVQDSKGFIWVATQDGLNKYDGEEVTIYRHNPSDPNSLSNNLIRKVFVDEQGVLWIGTQDGLNKFIPAQNNFVRYSADNRDNHSLLDNIIWDIYQNNANEILISSETGIQKYNPNEDNFSQIKIRGFEDKTYEIKTIFQDDDNNYWLGTFENGIYITNSNLAYAVSLKENNRWKLIIDVNSLFDIKKIHNKYWLATDKGLFSVSKNYELVDHYTANNDTSTSLLSNKVRSIEQFDKNHIWIGTKNGLNILNLVNGDVTKHQSKDHPNAITNNWIMDIYKDNSGVIWLATNGKSVSIYHPDQKFFPHALYDFDNITIGALVETANKKIWFILEDKIIKSIDIDGTINQEKINLEEEIFQLKSGNKNELWAVSFQNILYQINTETKIQVKHPQWAENSNYNADYQFIYLNNIIWFITFDGELTSYDTKNQTFEKVVSDQEYDLKAINHEGNNTLWFTSSSKLLLSYDISTKNFTSHKISNTVNFDKIENIIVSDNWIWLTSIFGVVLIDRSSLEATVFDINNQLKNNYISSLLIDSKENAWLSSKNEIILIEPKLSKVKRFGESYGLSQNEFIYNAGLKTSIGELYFGGINGFHSFNPEVTSQINQELTAPVLTDLFIANRKVEITPNFVNNLNKNKSVFFLPEEIDHVTEVTFKHSQSPFSIEFISPNTKNPSGLAYKYRLKGLETDWIEAGERNRRATYTNLSAGDYVFELEAYDVSGISQSKVRHLNIEILPPWWLSKISIAVYALILLLLAQYIYQQMRYKRSYNIKVKLSEERLKLSLWGSGDEMWDWNISTGRIFRSNIWGILEFPQDGRRNIGKEKTNIHQQDLSRVNKSLTAHFDEETDHFEETYRIKDNNNNWVWVLDRGKIVHRNDQNIPTRMTGTLKDISKIKQSEERLKLFANCIQNISDSVSIYDNQFQIVDVNQSYQHITGLQRQQIIGTVLKFNQYPEDFTANMKRHLLTKGCWHGEVKSQRVNGEEYLIDLRIDIIKDNDGRISNFVAIASDITARKESENELNKLASSDSLTGLPNRSFFTTRQTELVNNNVPHALLVIDLDNFKKINDSMNHHVGDTLLCTVADRMVKASEGQYNVYRLGGDEFSIIVDGTNDIHTIISIAKKILLNIALPTRLKDQEIVISSSIGIVLYPEDGGSSQELLKNADTAMYHAKDEGGNNYQFFNNAMNKKAVKRLQIENLIRHGINEDCFSVFYQPKIRVSTGEIDGMEALVRFETPGKAIISPIVFIPVSEETGQIIDIGEIVLRKSCRAAKEWVSDGLLDGRVAVNLSAVQFKQSNLVDMIVKILAETQLPAEHLELEITEGTVMEFPKEAIETMLKIRALGVHLSLDDFGTGYSSLAYLKKFPLNTLKIDKAFIDDIEDSEQGRNMVETIVNIAHSLELDVVAEGVENKNQFAFLSEIKCEQLQGYLYSKPIPKEEFKQLLVDQKNGHITATINRA